MTLRSSWAPCPTAWMVAFGSVVGTGCGDDSQTGGSGGAKTTASTTTRSASTTRASTAAQSVTVDATSSATGSPGRADGAPCTTDAECAGGTCFTEALYGFPGGQCTEDCQDSGTCSDPSSICDVTFCVRPCDPDVEGSCGMPATLACHRVGEHAGTLENPRLPSGPLWDAAAWCAADCRTNADCSGGRVCDGDPLRPRCVVPEVCDNLLNDNTSNYLSDCEDGSCATDPICTAAFADECTGAVALQLGSTTGDTSTGEANFVGNCAGDEGSPEIVYSFTPLATGDYAIHLTSESDLGFYVLEQCANRASELGCRNLYPGGEPESASSRIVCHCWRSSRFESMSATATKRLRQRSASLRATFAWARSRTKSTFSRRRAHASRRIANDSGVVSGVPAWRGGRGYCTVVRR